ncbi:unnamed protein product, partial [Oikopleura dioica]
TAKIPKTSGTASGNGARMISKNPKIQKEEELSGWE